MQSRVFSCFLAFAAVVLLAGSALAQQRFNVALNTIQEVPPAVPSNGRGTCQVTLNLTRTQITTVTCSFSNLSSNLTQGHIHGPAAPGTNAGVLIDLTPPTGVTSGTFTRGPFNITPAQLNEMLSKRWYINLHTGNFPNGEIRGQIKLANTVTDVDGDGRTDITVFRQSNNTFYSLNSINNNFTVYQFGSGTGDNFLNSMANDFDGDGRFDSNLIKLVGAGEVFWSVAQSGTNTVRTVMWGNFAAANTEALVPADWDGDGRTDFATYRRAEGRFYILDSATNTTRVINWGTSGNPAGTGDIPSVGDFDGDGKADPTVVRAGFWYTLLSSTNQMRVAYWGVGDTISFFTPYDFDGDGRQDYVTRRAVGGQFQFNILRSSDNQAEYITHGLSTDATAPNAILFGDYDGDGRTDIVARRAIGGILTWFIRQSSNQQIRVVQFGITGDTRPAEPIEPAFSLEEATDTEF